METHLSARGAETAQIAASQKARTGPQRVLEAPAVRDPPGATRVERANDDASVSSGDPAELANRARHVINKLEHRQGDRGVERFALEGKRTDVIANQRHQYVLSGDFEHACICVETGGPRPGRDQVLEEPPRSAPRIEDPRSAQESEGVTDRRNLDVERVPAPAPVEPPVVGAGGSEGVSGELRCRDGHGTGAVPSCAGRAAVCGVPSGLTA